MFRYRCLYREEAKSFTEVTAPKSHMPANSIIPAYMSGSAKLPLFFENPTLSYYWISLSLTRRRFIARARVAWAS